MDLELANKRLQARIKELEQELVLIKSRLSESQVQLNRVHLKLAEVSRIKVNNDVPNDRSSKIVVLSNCNPNKALSTKAKVKSRQKVIYGILKNPKRYNLSQAEKDFLISIEKIKTLSQKQHDWLTSIKNRSN